MMVGGVPRGKAGGACRLTVGYGSGESGCPISGSGISTPLPKFGENGTFSLAKERVVNVQLA